MRSLRVSDFPLERLRKRADFLKIAKTTERTITPAFIMQVHRTAAAGSPARYGITVSRKVGSAVARNRGKRRLRVLIRETFPTLAVPGVDYVLIARKEILRRTFAEMKKELERALLKARSQSCGVAENQKRKNETKCLNPQTP